MTGAPLAGEILTPGQSLALAWQAADNVAVADVRVELSCDAGASWQATGIAAPGARGAGHWVVPDLACARALLRAVARDGSGNTAEDRSDEFRIDGGTTTDVPDAGSLVLGPCVPNPFNPRAEIRYALPAAGPVALTVHDARGRRVADLFRGHRAAGPHAVVWEGRDHAGRELPSGVYWVRAQGPGGGAILKVTLVR
jgi:hypothetical protein